MVRRLKRTTANKNEKKRKKNEMREPKKMEDAAHLEHENFCVCVWLWNDDPPRFTYVTVGVFQFCRVSRFKTHTHIAEKKKHEKIFYLF